MVVSMKEVVTVMLWCPACWERVSRYGLCERYSASKGECGWNAKRCQLMCCLSGLVLPIWPGRFI